MIRSNWPQSDFYHPQVMQDRIYRYCIITTKLHLLEQELNAVNEISLRL